MNLRPAPRPPPVTLLVMMTGYWVSQALYVVAKLGVADLLVNGPQSVEHLAAATQAHVASLRRVLRALASVGVFTEASPSVYALTPLAALLRTDTADSMRALAIMYAEEQYRAWGTALHSVQTGETAFDKLEASKNRLNVMANRPLVRLGDAGDWRWRATRIF